MNSRTSYIRDLLRQSSFTSSILPKKVEFIRKTAHEKALECARIKNMLNTELLNFDVRNRENSIFGNGNNLGCPVCPASIRFDGDFYVFTVEDLKDAPRSLVGNGACVSVCTCSSKHKSIFVQGSNEVSDTFAPSPVWQMRFDNPHDPDERL